jgi:hypothetical protein
LTIKLAENDKEKEERKKKRSNTLVNKTKKISEENERKKDN